MGWSKRFHYQILTNRRRVSLCSWVVLLVCVCVLFSFLPRKRRKEGIRLGSTLTHAHAHTLTHAENDWWFLNLLTWYLYKGGRNHKFPSGVLHLITSKVQIVRRFSSFSSSRLGFKNSFFFPMIFFCIENANEEGKKSFKKRKRLKACRRWIMSEWKRRAVYIAGVGSC